MQFDMTVVLKDLKDEDLMVQDYFTNPKFVDTLETPNDDPSGMRLIKRTLSSVCVNALSAALKDDDKLSAEKKLEFFNLALRIQDNDHAELNVKQLKTIMDRIGKNNGVLVMGRAFEILDPTSDDGEEKPEADKSNA